MAEDRHDITKAGAFAGVGNEFSIRSTAFEEGGWIPLKHASIGKSRGQHDISPPLYWAGLPVGTEELALVLEDLDAPEEAPIVPTVHWIVTNIPPTVEGLPSGFVSKQYADDEQYSSVKEGVNDFEHLGYTGPRAETKEHRYVYTLYALDKRLKFGDKITKEKLEKAMDGHIMGEAKLAALFSPHERGDVPHV